MKLIIAIINDEFSQDVIKALIDAKVRATKLSSTGGFRKKGNTTLLIGVEENDLVSVVGLIRKHVNADGVSNGVEEGLEESGANLFIVDIDKHERI